MVAVAFATNSYKLQSLPISAQECINASAEREPQDAKTPVAVRGCPGLSAFATCGSGPVRGFAMMGGVVYCVSGTGLYSISSTGTAALVGGAVTGSGVVSMTTNGLQLCIVNGTLGYIYTTTAGFQVITDAAFYPANTVTFFDQYFVFDRAGTPYVFLSGLLDGTSYNALDTASAEVQPQNVQATVNQQESLIVFSTGHIETWYDSGAVNFPFQRIDGGTIERGLVAPYATVKEDNSIFFLADDLVFYRLDGVVPRRVSTHALEQEWQTFVTVTDAFCFSMTVEGHKVVYLTFPQGNATFAWDIASGLWHRRRSYDMSSNSLGRWRANAHIRAYGQDLIGDAFSGTVGYVDVTSATEYGNPMPILLDSPQAHQDRKRLFFSNFELDIESGVGLVSGQGSDPQGMLRWSNDGSRTWSSLQKWKSLGRQGAYTTRLRWPGALGQGRQRAWRLEISDPVRRTILSATCDVSVGQ